MTAALNRPISFPDIGISEQEQDPNSALLELDRGIYIKILLIPCFFLIYCFQNCVLCVQLKQNLSLLFV